MPTTPVKPFLIATDCDGNVRLTVRETRYNSQDYPWILATLVDQTFKTAAAAKAYASEQFGAKAGEYASR